MALAYEFEAGCTDSFDPVVAEGGGVQGDNAEVGQHQEAHLVAAHRLQVRVGAGGGRREVRKERTGHHPSGLCGR